MQQEHVKPGQDLEPYVQDALDEIEYVTGGTDTKWGAVRAKTATQSHSRSPTSKSATKIPSIVRQHYDGTVRAVLQGHQGKVSQPANHRDHAGEGNYSGCAGRSLLPASEQNSSTTPAHYDKTDRNGPKIFVGRMGHARRNTGAKLRRSARRCSLDDRDGAEQRHHRDGCLCAVAGQRQSRRHAVGHRLNRLRSGRSYGSTSYYAQVMFQLSWQ